MNSNLDDKKYKEDNNYRDIDKDRKGE